jgi:hypothetical protein
MQHTQIFDLQFFQCGFLYSVCVVQWGRMNNSSQWIFGFVYLFDGDWLEMGTNVPNATEVREIRAKEIVPIVRNEMDSVVA